MSGNEAGQAPVDNVWKGDGVSISDSVFQHTSIVFG
jgi:hypothetical protein